jgi:hypothetical protein
MRRGNKSTRRLIRFPLCRYCGLDDGPRNFALGLLLFQTAIVVNGQTNDFVAGDAHFEKMFIAYFSGGSV